MALSVSIGQVPLGLHEKHSSIFKLEEIPFQTTKLSMRNEKTFYHHFCSIEEKLNKIMASDFFMMTTEMGFYIEVGGIVWLVGPFNYQVLWYTVHYLWLFNCWLQPFSTNIRKDELANPKVS